MKKIHFYTSALSLVIFSPLIHASDINELARTLYSYSEASRNASQPLEHDATAADILNLVRVQYSSVTDIPNNALDYLNNQAVKQHLQTFTMAFNEGKNLSAVVSFQKALQKNDNQIIGHNDFYAASLAYDALASQEKSPEQQGTYLNSARKMVEEALKKSKTREPRYLFKAAELAVRAHDYKTLSKIAAEITETSPEEPGYFSSYPRFLDAYLKNDLNEAHKLVKLSLTNQNNRQSITVEVCNNFISIACERNDYDLAFDILKLSSMKKLFEFYPRNTVSCLGRTFLHLNKTNELEELAIMAIKTVDIHTIKELAHVYESNNLYDKAWQYWRNILSIQSSKKTHEAAQAFLSRAIVGEKNTRKRKIYLENLRALKRKNVQDSHSNENIESDFGAPPKSKGHLMRHLIANRYSESVKNYFDRAMKFKAPELESLKGIMREYHTSSQKILETLLASSEPASRTQQTPESPSTDLSVIEIRSLMNEMKEILKTMEREADVLARQNRTQQLKNTSVQTPYLPSVQKTNLRSEVLSNHGLPQAREKKTQTTTTFLTQTETETETQTQPLYTIKWKWTHSAEKQNCDLSPEIQTKITTFMGEIEQNPWSLRRDGSLASGEPRYVNGIASHTFERDLDKYNRFIYHVLPTGEETATVTILKVLGHL